MQCCGPMAVAFLDESNDAIPRFDRMRLAHRSILFSPQSKRGSHNQLNWNPESEKPRQALDQTEPDRGRCSLPTVCSAELARSLVEIGTHRAVADSQSIGDIRHGHAVCEPSQAFRLSR